jgi:hypothetical protein
MDKNFFKNHKQIVYLSTVLSIILYLFTYYLRNTNALYLWGFYKIRINAGGPCKF